VDGDDVAASIAAAIAVNDARTTLRSLPFAA
jgi:hypothetical protein